MIQTQVADGYQHALECLCFPLKPAPILSVCDWADKERILSKDTSSEAGKWKTSRTPYLAEIMETLSVYNRTQRIVFMKSAQCGGTECGLNWLGYTIDHAPAPMMMVQPTLKLVGRYSKKRVDPMIDASEILKSKVSAKKSRDSSNTIEQKDFLGGTLIMSGANSASSLRSMPAERIFCDEIDEYPDDIEEQGDPIELAWKRTKTFSKKKQFIVSTPTVEGASKIADWYEISDQRKYQVPCPECGHFQELDFFKGMSWPKGKPHEAFYTCEDCGVSIEHHQKTKMLAAGKWVKHNPDSRVAGFHISALCAPVGLGDDWGEIATEYERAKEQIEISGQDSRMKTFMNTSLGLPYRGKHDQPDAKRLYENRESYKQKVVPKGGLILVAGADIQKNRIEVEIVAYGRSYESWSVDYRIFYGDTSEDKVWEDFRSILSENFSVEETDQTMAIQCLAVDSGYNTSQVYKFVRSVGSTRCIAVKGREELMTPTGLSNHVDVKINGRTIRNGLLLWHIGVNYLKDEIYGHLRIERPVDNEPFPAGYCHFPEYEFKFFEMLTAEAVEIKIDQKRRAKRVYVKTRERNEALDCRVYARATLSVLGYERIKEADFDVLEKRLLTGTFSKPMLKEVNKEEKTVQKSAPIEKPRVKKKRNIRSIWE